MPITSFAEANQFFAHYYGPMPVKYSLDIMRRLMTALGNPQNNYKVIHVAGTSGKTSTAYYTTALLQAAGYKTGLTVSPHVDEINERVQIDLQPLAEEAFCISLNEFAELLEQSGVEPSWFEAIVAFAFWQFAKIGVDYAVIEVGLGGLLDATNVIDRADKICIITDIGLDHTKILGRTLPEIATQKAGIIQAGNQVFTYRQNQAVDNVFETVSRKQQARLEVVDVPPIDDHADLPRFQQRNFYLARQAVGFVLGRDGRPEIDQTQLQQVARTYIPGRMEISQSAGRTYILDGAHNAQKLEALKSSVAAKFPDQPVAALVAFMEGDGNRLDAALDVLGSIAGRVIVTSFVTAKDYIKHSVDPEIVAQLCKSRGIEALAIADQAEAFSALQRGGEEPVLLITGSFYLLNHIRPLMLRA